MAASILSTQRLRVFALDFLAFVFAVLAVLALALVPRPLAFRAAFFAGFRLTVFLAFRAATLAPRVARVTARFTVRRTALRGFAVFSATVLAALEIAAPAL
jgi:hypothetical protein